MFIKPDCHRTLKLWRKHLLRSELIWSFLVKSVHLYSAINSSDSLSRLQHLNNPKSKAKALKRTDAGQVLGENDLCSLRVFFFSKFHLMLNYLVFNHIRGQDSSKKRGLMQRMSRIKPGPPPRTKFPSGPLGKQSRGHSLPGGSFFSYVIIYELHATDWQPLCLHKDLQGDFPPASPLSW